MTQGSGDAAIRLVGVRKEFEGAARPAVGNLSFDVPAGALVAMVGPSGCGKTTTLKMINRLIEPTAGEIYVEGVEIRSLPAAQLRRRIGYVIQQIGLFPHRTISANIATVPRLLGWDRKRIKERVAELVDLVGLDADLLPRYPAELSGGQQQRVGVARALAADPPVLLMDEPYSAVDPIVRAHLQDELIALQRRVQKTIVLVTHDIDEAIKLSDRIALMNVGGVLEQYATPDELLRAPANEFVEHFLGHERGLKRLSLLKVRDVDLVDGPVVGCDATPEEAERVMAKFAYDWVGVLDGDRLLGWVDRASLEGKTRVGDAEMRRFSTPVHPDTPLRETLDALVISRTNVAVVFDDDDRYLGMLTIEQISEGVR
ncbi:MAG: osmoprotectant transport system ATP-binding protein [Actinomycetota bacterium]|nr:osmoprotectant transport system ATP-binding protein [Actinomycetota bacterium]